MATDKSTATSSHFGSTDMFRDLEHQHTDNTQHGVANDLVLRICSAAKESLNDNEKHIPQGSFSLAQDPIVKTSIAAISTLQTPLLHSAEWRNFQQVPKLVFLRTRLAPWSH